jgi:membrane associated rhomboid family serine protease
MQGRAPVTTLILVAIAAMFGVELLTHALTDLDMLIRLGAIMPIGYGQYWRFVTGMFLHGSWLHWASNSWALWQLGTLFEHLFGSRRFTLIYFATGICASLASSMTGHGPAVGASGAIFGLLGALLVAIRRSPLYRHQPWTRGLSGQFLFWIVVNLVIGSQVAVIDNTAHIGGLIAGLLLGFLPHRVPPPPPSSSVIEIRPQ